MLYSSKRFYNKPLPCFGKRCILQHNVENSRAGRQVVAGDQKEMRTVRYGESYYIYASVSYIPSTQWFLLYFQFFMVIDITASKLAMSASGAEC